MLMRRDQIQSRSLIFAGKEKIGEIEILDSAGQRYRIRNILCGDEAGRAEAPA